MIRKLQGQQSSDTLSPAATGSGISQALSPSWNTVSKDEFLRPGNSLLDAGKAFAAGSRETTAAETVFSSLTQGGRTSSLRASKMNSSPSEGVIKVCPLEVGSARPSLQTLVSDSPQFSYGEKASTRKQLLLQRRWRRKRKLPRCGPCRVNRWVVLLLYCLYCVFAGPAYINWTPLADILFRAGAFTWMCDDNSSNPAAPAAHSPLAAAPALPPATHRGSAEAAASDGRVFAAVDPATAERPGPADVAVLAAGNSAAVDNSTGDDVGSSCSTASLRQSAGLLSVSGECEAAAAASTGRTSSSSSESMVRCADQEAEVNRLFTITAASHFFFSFIGGMLLDSVGPKITSVIGLSLGMTGWILLGAANKDIHSYVAGCLFLGAGVDTTYFPLLSGANLFPGHVSTVKSLFGAAASFSFAVPLVLRAVYFTTNAQIKHSTLFFGYASVCMGAALLIAIFVVPWKPWKSPYRSLLSGERQRSHPLAAACGLATQSSQLPVAASDRAFDVIAVNYSSSSSPSSPSSLSALPEEPAAPCSRDSNRDSSRLSRDSSRDSSPASNLPAARCLAHHDGDRSSLTGVKAPHTLTAEHGQCYSPSRPHSESPVLPPLLLSPASCRSNSSSNSNSDNRCPFVESRAAARPAQQRNHSDHKTPSKSAAAGIRLLQMDGSSSNTGDNLPGDSAGEMSGSCSPWQRSDAQQQHNHSPPFFLDTATTLTPPWKPRRDRGRDHSSARPAAAARTAAVLLRAASATVAASGTCAALKSHDGASAAPVDSSTISSASAATAAAAPAATETPPGAAAPSMLLGGTTAGSAASSTASSPHKGRAGEGRLARTHGKRRHRYFPENKFGTSGLSSFTVPPVPVPLCKLPSAGAHPRYPYVPACSDDSLPKWNRRPLRPSSSVVFPSSSSSSSSSSSLSFKLISSSLCPASSVSRLSSSYPLQAVFPMPSYVCTPPDSLQALTARSAPASGVSASCCVGQGRTAPTREASLPRQPVSVKAAPLARRTPVACCKNSPEEAQKGTRCCRYANELALELPPRYATVSAVHAAAAALHEGDPTVSTAAERALEPPSLHDEKHSQPVKATSSSVCADEASHVQTAAMADSCGCAVAAPPSAERHAAAQYHRVASVKTSPTCNRATAAAAAPATSASAVAACAGGCSSDMPADHPIVNAASPATAGASVMLLEGDAGPAAATQEANTNPASIPTARRGLGAAATAAIVSPLPALSQQTPACRAADAGPMPTRAAAGATTAAAGETAATAGATAAAAPYDPPGAALPPPPASASPIRGSSKRRFLFLRSSLGRRSSRLQDKTVQRRRCREQLLSIRRDFLSSMFLPIVPFFCIILTGMVFFIPSARHLLPSAYAANRIIQIFSFLPCPLFGHIADVCGIMPVMYICNGCGLLSFVFVMIPQIPAAVPLQYLASLLSASQLSFLVCQICCYVAETFDDENQGKLIGTLCCIAGLTSLSAHYVMDYAVRHGFFKPLIVFIIAVAINFLLLAFVHWRKQRTHRMHAGGRVFRSRELPDAAAALSAHRRRRLRPLFVEMSAAAEAPSPPSPPLRAPSDSSVEKAGSGASAAAITAAAGAVAFAAASSETSRPPTFVAAPADTTAEAERTAAAGHGGAAAADAKTITAALQQQQQEWTKEEASRRRAERRKEREWTERGARGDRDWSAAVTQRQMPCREKWGTGDVAAQAS